MLGAGIWRVGLVGTQCNDHQKYGMNTGIKLRLIAVSVIALLSLALAVATTYVYGMTFSHPRYWNGTIERVTVVQSALIESLISEVGEGREFLPSSDRMENMFQAVKNKMIVESVKNGEIEWTNFNGKYSRGDVLRKIDVGGGRSIILSRYKPPEWNYLFLRWLKSPTRWFEPSYDHVTFPFFWFSSIYLVSILAFVFMIKSRYLERDVLNVFREIEARYRQ